MKPIEIKIALMRKGITHKQIAQELGVSSAAISRIIYGHSKSKRIWNHISSLIQLKKAA